MTRLPPSRTSAPSATPASTYAVTLSRWPCEISAPVSAFSSNGPPSRISPRPLDQLVDELVVDRLLDDQPRAGGADLAGVQEDRGERHVERGLAVGVGEDDVGVLAAELEGDLLHRAGRGGHDPLAGAEPAGEGDQVDARVLAERRARRCGPSPTTRLPTPAGSPASSSSRIRWMAVWGESSLGLSTKVQPAASAGATFQDTCSSG